MTHDLLIVGSGLTGSTIARLSKDAGYNPLVVERRSVVGGNIRDDTHEETGLRYNLYGPHYFRTNSDRIWTFVNRFSSWRPWAAEVMTIVDGRLEHWPPNREYVEKIAPRWREAPITSEDRSFEDVCKAKMPWQIYGSMVLPYTGKQWGLSANELLPSLASRFSIREDSNDHRLTTHKYQALPVDGYSKLIENMLEGIEVDLNHKNFSLLYMDACREDIFVHTGPIDELFDCRFGKLPYRGQQRKFISDMFYQPTIQLNIPLPEMPQIRTIDWNYMTSPDWETVPRLVMSETPFTPTDFDQCEYPVPTQAAHNKYHSYYQYAKQFPNLILAGRLAEYRYLDMDQAIGRAFTTWEKRVKPRLESKR